MKNKLYIFAAFLFLNYFSFGDTIDYYYEEETLEIVSDFDSDFEEEYFPTIPKEERIDAENYNRNLNPKFKDNYTGRAFDYDRVVEEKDFDKKFININPMFLTIFSYIGIGLFAILLIYLIIRNSGGFRLRGKGQKIDYKIYDSDEELKDIKDLNFQSLIEKAKSEGDFRRGVRYYYLWMLQNLGEKNLIQWHKNKTAQDYFLELNNQNIQNDFRDGTYVYNHVWYGNFPVNPQEFKTIENLFGEILKKI